MLHLRHFWYKSRVVRPGFLEYIYSNIYIIICIYIYGKTGCFLKKMTYSNPKLDK